MLPAALLEGPFGPRAVGRAGIGLYRSARTRRKKTGERSPVFFSSRARSYGVLPTAALTLLVADAVAGSVTDAGAGAVALTVL